MAHLCGHTSKHRVSSLLSLLIWLAQFLCKKIVALGQTGVTRIFSQLNVTGTVAWHLSPSSTKQLHQVLPWEATTELLLHHMGGGSVWDQESWAPAFVSQLCHREDVKGWRTLFPGNNTLPLTQTHSGITPGNFCLNPPGCKIQEYLHLIKLVCKKEHGLFVPCLQLYISEERRLLPWERGTWVERGLQHTQELFNKQADRCVSLTVLTSSNICHRTAKYVTACLAGGKGWGIELRKWQGCLGMWKWQLSEQNGLWQPSTLSHTHGHAPGAISQLSRVAEQVMQHLREEISTGTTCLHLFFFGHRAQQQSRRCGRAVWGEGSLPVSQPQEPWNCRPLPAEKQQEILVEGDKETAVVTHLGAAPEPPSWLCLGKTCQLCWKESFFLGQTSPQSPVLLAALMASHILAWPRSYHRDTLLPLMCIWLICPSKEVFHDIAKVWGVFLCSQLLAYSGVSVRTN